METHPKPEPTEAATFFATKGPWNWLILCLLFIAALGIRLYNIDQPPMDFHPTRQYRSALLARAMYYETSKSIPAWQKDVARANKGGILEAPVMECLAYLSYRVAGKENVAIPRVFSIVFWLIGAYFLYLLARDMISNDGAVIAVGFYLFLPFGIVASRSFQPDPLMVSLFVCSLFFICQYTLRPSISILVPASLISSLAIFVKPVCAFPIFGAFISMMIFQEGVRKSLRSVGLLVFVFVSILPTLVFYGYGLFIAGFLRSQAHASILPHLVLEAFFWKSWLSLVVRVIGGFALIVALLGVLLLRGGLTKALLIGLWSGYFIFGLVFTYHIHTHDYYHIVLIPTVALSLGSAAPVILNRLHYTCSTRVWRLVAWGVFILAVFLCIREASWRLRNTGFQTRVKIAQEIGKRIGHSTDTIFLAQDYGKILKYHGDLGGLSWPTGIDFRAQELRGERIMSAEERLAAWLSDHSLHFFIVTDFEELERQDDLKRLLTSAFPVLEANEDYVIFDLKKRINPSKQ